MGRETAKPGGGDCSDCGQGLEKSKKMLEHGSSFRGEQWSRVDPGPTLDRPNPTGPGPVPKGTGLVLGLEIPGPTLYRLVLGPKSFGSVQP